MIVLGSMTFPQKIIRIDEREEPQKKLKKSFNAKDISVSVITVLRDRCNSILSSSTLSC